MHRKSKKFLIIYKLAEKKYKTSNKRLAGDAWQEHWQTLLTTILSAQTRDEVTIPIAENLFKKYPSLEKLSNAKEADIFQIIKSINYNKTKAKHLLASSQYLLKYHQEMIPDTVEELTKIPGVGLKTANLILAQCHKKDAICVDTHVHRIMNIFKIVNTKNPQETESALKKIAPIKYWSKINRYFVLLGKEVPGYSPSNFIKKLKEK